MNTEEFAIITQKLKGGRNGWIERVSELTGIDKPTLSKYASGERDITKPHALFLRQTYFLHCGFSDLANDLNVMIRSDISARNDLPVYSNIKEKSALLAEIKTFASGMKKIRKISSAF
jgi:transcriptional regulator with XRE-family HTH domain